MRNAVRERLTSVVVTDTTSDGSANTQRLNVECIHIIAFVLFVEMGVFATHSQHFSRPFKYENVSPATFASSNVRLNLLFI